MQVRIMSRAKAVKLSYTELTSDKVIISICDPFAEQASFNRENSSIKDVLNLSFYDVCEETRSIYPGCEPMTPDDAMKVARFVEKWKDKVSEIWVHCEIGVSRSAGVAAAIMEALGLDMTPIFENETLCPNMLCYELTRNAFDEMEKAAEEGGRKEKG